MEIKNVRKWQANGIVAIAVNTENKSGILYKQFNEWRINPANQPLTSLVGEFDAEDMEVKEVWEFRTWSEDNEMWFDWVSSTKYYCNTLKGKHETRQSYELIPKVKEVMQGEGDRDLIHKLAKKYAMENNIPITGAFYEAFIVGYRSNKATQQTEPLIKALKEINNISDWSDLIGKKVSKIVTKALKGVDK